MSETGLQADDLSGLPTADSAAESGLVPPTVPDKQDEPQAKVAFPSPAKPASSEADFQPLDSRIISAERIANWIFFAFVAVGGLVAQAIYVAMNWPPGTTSSLISGTSAIIYVLVLVFLVWAGHYYPVLAYRHAAWRLSEQGLEIRRGVWWKHEITVPRARVQHTDVHQGPLMRRFELARLVINTAGTQNASIALDGLSFETAQRLRGELVADCEVRSTPQEPR